MAHSIFEDKNRLEKFKNLINKYNINYDFAFRLREIEGFDIVMILDDSTSMATPVIDREQTHHLSPFHQLPTRWDELKHIVSIIVDLASTLDPDGIDIYFLNRPPLLHVNDSSQLTDTFTKLPHGSSPLVRVLNEVLNLKRSELIERKLLILIATDGLPTDENGGNDLKNLENILRNKRYPIDSTYVTFLACTNDLQSVGYLNQLDKQIPFVDVLDDYRSERTEVLRVQGKNFPFSHGDYVVKLLMGSIDQWFDQLDEKKVQLTNTNIKQQQHKSTRDKNCIIS